jgi:hypothetical protein
MRYADQLRQATGPASWRTPRADRLRRRYLRQGAGKLAAAACADSPVLALGRLADEYQGDYERGAEPRSASETLLRACLALIEGEDPDPVPAETPQPEAR